MSQGNLNLLQDELLQQLPRLQQLQHCKLGCFNDGASWRQPAAELTVLCGLGQLTYLGLERGGLAAKELAQLLYCQPDALPQLRVLEIKDAAAITGMPCNGCEPQPLDDDDIRLKAEVGA
jgi:hypothetical protein